MEFRKNILCDTWGTSSFLQECLMFLELMTISSQFCSKSSSRLFNLNTSRYLRFSIVHPQLSVGFHSVLPNLWGLCSCREPGGNKVSHGWRLCWKNVIRQPVPYLSDPICGEAAVCKQAATLKSVCFGPCPCCWCVRGWLSGWIAFSLFLFLSFFFFLFNLKICCCPFLEAWPSPRPFHFFLCSEVGP